MAADVQEEENRYNETHNKNKILQAEIIILNTKIQGMKEEMQSKNNNKAAEEVSTQQLIGYRETISRLELEKERFIVETSNLKEEVHSSILY